MGYHQLLVGGWPTPLKNMKELKIIYTLSGWWFWATPLKNDEVKVSCDYDIPNRWKNKNHFPNHQPDNKKLVYDTQNNSYNYI